MKSSASKIQLTGYDALFQTSDPVKANGDLVQFTPGRFFILSPRPHLRV